jgi:hypothetical protein
MHRHGDKIGHRGNPVLHRLRPIALLILCLTIVPLAGCARKGPISVRFTRDIDETKLLELPKRDGSVVLVAGADFWTDRKRISKIPIARREKMFIIGPSAAGMAERMLGQMFVGVERVRHLDRVADPSQFDYVIRLIHTYFDDRTLFLPLFSNQRYRVDISATVTRIDGSVIGEAIGRGSESFWTVNLADANPFEGDQRLLDKAGKTLNAAVQESLFELMNDLEPLFDRER